MGGGEKARCDGPHSLPVPGLLVQNLTDGDEETIGRKRLLKERAVPVGYFTADLVSLGVSGHVNNPYAGPALPDAPHQLRASHVRHDDIGKDQVNGAANLVGDPERLLTVAGRKHEIALVPQNPGCNGEYGLFVLDQENRLGSPGRADGPFGGGKILTLRINPGKADLEDGAPPRLAVYIDVPAALSHNAVDGSQAQAGILGRGFGGKKWLEQPPFDLRGHPVAGVTHHKHDIRPGRDVDARVPVRVTFRQL